MPGAGRRSARRLPPAGQCLRHRLLRARAAAAERRLDQIGPRSTATAGRSTDRRSQRPWSRASPIRPSRCRRASGTPGRPRPTGSRRSRRARPPSLRSLSTRARRSASSASSRAARARRASRLPPSRAGRTRSRSGHRGATHPTPSGSPGAWPRSRQRRRSWRRPGDGQVSLSWNPPSSDGGAAIGSYRIYRGTSPGNETQLTTVPETQHSLVDRPLTNGTAYYYVVTALNAVGEGPVSNELSATPAAPPDAPTLVSAIGGDSSVALAWRPPGLDGGIADRGLQDLPGSSAGRRDAARDRRQRDLVHRLDRRQRHDVLLRGHRASTPSFESDTRSNELSATPRAVPGAPALTAATGGNAKVDLAWSAPASNGGSAVTGYRVYRSTSAGGETLLATLGAVDDVLRHEPSRTRRRTSTRSRP